MSASTELVGLLRVRNCCLFTWRERRVAGDRPGERFIEISPEHCESCVGYLRTLDLPIRLVSADDAVASTPTGAGVAVMAAPTGPDVAVMAALTSPCRVLIVDDDAATREALADSLGEMGCEVTSAENGQAALALLQSGAPLPRLILLDLMMPVMDGHQFRERQAQDPRLADIPVIVITAAPPPARMLSVPMLRKPLDLLVLANIVHRHVPRLGSDQSSP